MPPVISIIQWLALNVPRILHEKATQQFPCKSYLKMVLIIYQIPFILQKKIAKLPKLPSPTVPKMKGAQSLVVAHN